MACPQAKAQNNKVCSTSSPNCGGKQYVQSVYPPPMGSVTPTQNDCNIPYTSAKAVAPKEGDPPCTVP